MTLNQKYSLSYFDAIEKSLQIVNFDKEHFKDFEEFPIQSQMEGLIGFFTHVDPDKIFAAFTTKEPDLVTMKADLKNIFGALMRGESNDCSVSRQLAKYELTFNVQDGKAIFELTELLKVFPEECYEVVTSINSISNPFISLVGDSLIYSNFKGAYYIPGMPALLPKNQKYGGFIKAFLHMTLLREKNVFHDARMSLKVLISQNRAYFNSKIYSDKKRNEFFQKLDIKEEDCIQWTEIFDKNFPAYKNIHKFFGQIA